MLCCFAYFQSRNVHIFVNFGHCWPWQFSLGWSWVDVITACALTGTGRMRTLEMSIVERGGGEDDGGEGRVRRMVGDWVALLFIYSLYSCASSSLGGERSS